MNRYFIIILMILILPISPLTGSHSHVNLDKASIMEQQTLVDLSHTQNGPTDKVVFFPLFFAIIVIYLLKQSSDFQISSVIRKILFTPIFYQSNYLVYSPLTRKAL